LLAQSFIAKPYCILCGKKLDISIFENMECAKCIGQKPTYTLARSLVKFDEYSKKVIHAFKYHDKTGLAKVFAKLILQRYGPEVFNADLIAPVPMHKLKRLFRLYNQSHILAKEIAKLLKKPLQPDLLIKSKWTQPQASLSKLEREKNLSNSLKFNTRYSIKGKNILLVDDVLTTGTTVTKCTKLLKHAGANSIYVLTIAMT
jgi:ComF family protein